MMSWVTAVATAAAPKRAAVMMVDFSGHVDRIHW
jgi:hypothetical protein